MLIGVPLIFTAALLSRFMEDVDFMLTVEPSSVAPPVEVSADPNIKDGCLVIKVDYYVIGSNTRDNFVFPFYLNTGEEEAAQEEFAPEQGDTEEQYED